MWKIFGVILCSCIYAITTQSCTITLPKDIRGLGPVILRKSASSYDIFKPTGRVNNFHEGSVLHFVCTGTNNVLKPQGVSSLDLQCREGRFVDSDYNPVALNTLVCKSIPLSTLKITNTKCSNSRGLIYESGVEVYEKFYPTFEICYDKQSETTFYTHNTLHGATISYNIYEKSRPPFSATGMKSNTKTVNFYYSLNNQLERFIKYFGRDQTYIDKKNFLSRGHLSPHADFMFGYDQHSTYYYANVAPQYQPINGGNWVTVEQKARTLAAAYNDDIESYNGYMGIVQFPSNKSPTEKVLLLILFNHLKVPKELRSIDPMVKVYLDPTHEIYIPKYYFKVLWHKSSDSAIVFVTVNNPFTPNGQADEFCENVCANAKLDYKLFTVAARGHTFCCTLDEFKKHYNGLPIEVSAKNLLMGE